jgi:hypothetical protein
MGLGRERDVGQRRNYVMVCWLCVCVARVEGWCMAVLVLVTAYLWETCDGCSGECDMLFGLVQVTGIVIPFSWQTK